MLRLLLCALPLAAAPLAAQAPIEYEAAFPNRAHHEARIEVRFEDVRSGPLEVRMSRASPGRYALHEFAKNVYGLVAVDGAGDTLAVTRPDPYSWLVHDHDGTVRVMYTLFGDRTDGTYAGIDASHAHLNMPASFLWAPTLADRPIRIRFVLPPDEDWRVATQLAPTTSPGTFTAPDLQYFMDSPTELSAFALREWTEPTAGGEPTIRFALHHTGTAEQLDAYVALVKELIKEHEAVFGELPDFDYGTYTFIADYLPWASGDGMEHRNSTILTSTRTLEDAALDLLGTVSHEFIHAWNVERIRPAALEPFDFTRANMTYALWFAEGFTSYYDDLLITRAGFYDLDRLAADLGSSINTVVNSPGRALFSAAEMSMHAPFVDAATAIDPTNFANTFISYYTWGAAIALGLDLTLRTEFDTTLDAYMRAMWRRHGEPEVPYTLADLRIVLGRVAGDADFARRFFDRFIEGHDVPDYAALLAEAGLLLRPARPDAAFAGDVSLIEDDGALVIADATRRGSPLYEAGLDRGDRVLAVDGTVVATPAVFGDVVAEHEPGDTITLDVERRGRRGTVRVTLGTDPTLEVVTYEAAGMPVDAGVRAFRAEWLEAGG